MPAPSLSFQKRNIFINRCPAQIAHSGKFADIQMTAFVGGIMAEEDGGDIIFGGLRSADGSALCTGIGYTRPHTRPYHRKFQLAEHACHL